MIQQMIAWLRENIAAHEQKRRELWDDSREDEANFEKIIGNVYDIFLAVLSTAERVCREETEVQEFFLQKLEQIPSNWTIAMQKAEEHNETERSHIERMKLETAQKIKDKFCSFWEVSI